MSCAILFRHDIFHEEVTTPSMGELLSRTTCGETPNVISRYVGLPHHFLYKGGFRL